MAMPPPGMVTMVDASKVRRKRHPGRCYRKAGFRHASYAKSGLLVFQMLPAGMPEAGLAPGGQPLLFTGAAS